MTNYLVNGIDISFTESNVIPNGSNIITNYSKTYNGVTYDISQIYKSFDYIRNESFPYNSFNKTNYNCNINNIRYDIGQILYNTTFSKFNTFGSTTQNGVRNSSLVDGYINTIKILGSIIYVGGFFTMVSTSNQSISANNIAMWDGTKWLSFGSFSQNGTNNEVTTIDVSNTNIYVGGHFNKVYNESQGEVNVGYIAMWNGMWNVLGNSTKNGASREVKVIKILNSNVYVGGNFTTVYNSSTSSITASHIAMWNGTWNVFGDSTKNGTDAVVYTLDVSNTNVYVGGLFTTVYNSSISSITVGYIAMWNGTWNVLGNSTQNGANAPPLVIKILNSNVYVGGYFTTVYNSGTSSITASRIAMWNGTWNVLGNSTQNGTDSTVRTIDVSNTNVYVGGNFGTVYNSSTSSITATRIAMWNGTWNVLGNSTQNGASASGQVNVINILNSNVYVGGYFTTAYNSTTSTITVGNIAMWNGTWNVLGGYTTSGVYNNNIKSFINVIVYVNNKIYVGGSFSSVSSSTQNSITANNIAMWDGTQWYPLGTSLLNGTNNSVYSMDVSGSNIYVGGCFTTVSSSSTQNSITANNIAMWDGTQWYPLGTSLLNGTNASVYTIKISDSNIYIGGLFTGVYNVNNCLSASYIALWNNNNWLTLGSSSNTVQNGVFSSNLTVNPITTTNDKYSVTGIVYALGLYGTNVIYVGGSFSSVSSSTQNSITANNIAIWDNSYNTWSVLGSSTQNGTNNTVYTIKISGTSVYIGGSFNTVSSSTQNNITKNGVAIWNHLTTYSNYSNSTWSNLILDVYGTVYAIDVDSTYLYVGGSFSRVTSSGQSLTRRNFAIYRFSLNMWNSNNSYSASTPNTWGDMNGPVYAILVSGSNTYVGGLFSMATWSYGLDRPISNICVWTFNNYFTPLKTTQIPQSSTDNGTNGKVNTIAISGTNIYIGGSFTQQYVGTTVTNATYIARWNGSNGTWNTVGNGTNGEVNKISVAGTNLLFVGGLFTNVYQSSGTSIVANNFAYWQNTTWSFPYSPITNGRINTIAVGANVNLVVGGSFSVVSDQTNSFSANGIAVWSNTNTWIPYGVSSIYTSQNGTNNKVYSIDISNSNVYVGGSFTKVSSSTQNNISALRIANWNNNIWSILVSTNLSQNNALGVDGDVYTIKVSNNKVYIGGYFSVFVNQNNIVINISGINKIAVWDGNIWSGLTSQETPISVIQGSIYSIDVSGSNIYIGGSIDLLTSYNNVGTKLNQTLINHIAMWNGSKWLPLSTSNNGQSGIVGIVNTVKIIGASLYIGFSTIPFYGYNMSYNIVYGYNNFINNIFYVDCI
jgi:hypothetical protein